MTPYSTRRSKLITQMQAMGGGVAIVSTAPEMTRNADSDFPYRHDSSFYYLTGFTEPGAVLVLVSGKEPKSILFCREKDLERKIWDGYRLGPEAACAELGFDASFAIDAIDSEMPKLLTDMPTIFYTLGKQANRDAQLQSWLNKLGGQGRIDVSAPHAIHSLEPLLAEMRLFKDTGEQAIMQRSGQIAAGAHRRAMRIARPGLREYHLEAEILHEFRSNGAGFPAYTPIVATGSNACVLHYRAGNTELKDGDLVLIDAGCEFESYASDITRTFPVNGVFSRPQKTLYEIVLAAQVAAIAVTCAGQRFIDGHHAALRILVQGMLDTGLLNKSKVGTLDDVIANGDYRQFYMHNTGHWIGLDVHDVGAYREPGEIVPEGEQKPWRKLQPGMVTTVEPGIYVHPGEGVPEQFWHIGIRIEDDILVTTDGNINLTRDVPTAITEIEALMRK